MGTEPYQNSLPVFKGGLGPNKIEMTLEDITNNFYPKKLESREINKFK